jgi:hypothetical protein
VIELNALDGTELGDDRQDVCLLLDNVQVNDNVIYLPIYMLMFMQHEQTEDVVYKFQPI